MVQVRGGLGENGDEEVWDVSSGVGQTTPAELILRVQVKVGGVLSILWVL